MTQGLAPAGGWAGLSANPWAYPALEVVHIVGIALLLGNLVLVELRLWGLGAGLGLPAMARLALSVSLAGFGLAATSGLLMFATQPAELLANRAFVLKMTLLMVARVNAAIFHARRGLVSRDRIARAQTALSLGLWLGVIICGRWIAYQ